MAKFVRVLVYEGDPAWIRMTLYRSLEGKKTFGGENSITSSVPVELPENDSNWEPWFSYPVEKDR